MRQILKDIGLCKSVIINSLLDNQEIMELMLGKKYTDADVENIVYKQIFPYRDVLCPLVESGDVVNYELQKPYELQPKFIHGGKSVQSIKYIADFLLFTKTVMKKL